MSSESVESQLWGWETFFDELCIFLRELSRQYESCSETYGSYALERLQISISSVSRLKNHLEGNLARVELENRPIVLRYKCDMEQLVSYLRALSQEFQDNIDANERMAESRRICSMSFSWTEIATLIGVSRMTIYRRRDEFGMLQEPIRTLTDTELRSKLSDIRRVSPESGEKLILGQLRSMGYHITRSRVREALRSVDPINTALRWQGSVTARRPYSVPGPNSLWHIGQLHHYNTVNLPANKYTV